MSKEFYDENHARTYLIGGIIRFKNKPIYIRDLQEADRQGKKYKIIYSHVGDTNNLILFFPHDELNMKPVPLGMMDTQNTTWYVQRHPSRGWKIGLNSDNISYQRISGQKRDRPRNEHPNLQFNCTPLANCISGTYLTYKQALKTIIEGDRASAAFSRKFAINRGGLIFKSIDDTVGICERKGPILFDHFQYLQEVLEEDMER